MRVFLPNLFNRRCITELLTYNNENKWRRQDLTMSERMTCLLSSLSLSGFNGLNSRPLSDIWLMKELDWWRHWHWKHILSANVCKLALLWVSQGRINASNWFSLSVASNNITQRSFGTRDGHITRSIYYYIHYIVRNLLQPFVVVVKVGSAEESKRILVL